MKNDVEEKMLKVYTDGACLKNPGPGGWGFVLYNEGNILTEQSGGEIHTTNNRMELLAAICALDYCLLLSTYQPNPNADQTPLPDQIVLHTDSEYVKNGITQWLPRWVQNGWKGKSGAIKNQDLWEQLHEVNQQLDVKWEWVKGHAGVEGNELADVLATTAAKAVQNRAQSVEKRAQTIEQQKQRIYLSVPFADKDAAKGLGARWDGVKKKWYCDKTKSTVFEKWMK